MAEFARHQVRRRGMNLRPNSTFVEPHEFLKLLLSRRELIRADDFDGKVRGLLDVETGRRYLIKREKLVSC
jgi:hypothetical protein